MLFFFAFFFAFLFVIITLFFKCGKVSPENTFENVYLFTAYKNIRWLYSLEKLKNIPKQRWI
jgi:hypothetical protein